MKARDPCVGDLLYRASRTVRALDFTAVIIGGEEGSRADGDDGCARWSKILQGRSKNGLICS